MCLKLEQFYGCQVGALAHKFVLCISQGGGRACHQQTDNRQTEACERGWWLIEGPPDSLVSPCKYHVTSAWQDLLNFNVKKKYYYL